MYDGTLIPIPVWLIIPVDGSFCPEFTTFNSNYAKEHADSDTNVSYLVQSLQSRVTAIMCVMC